MSAHVYDVVVVGGGAAGVGVSVALKHAGINNFLVLERHEVGASFDRWPAETRFITPSFPTNSIGMLDLNAIALGISPAHSMQVEHPTGKEYASHLRSVARFFELPIREKTEVSRISMQVEMRAQGDGVGFAVDSFSVDVGGEILRGKHVIWAAGEYQYPQLNGFSGSEFCRHTATVASYAELDGDDFIVIGGYESGVDVAYHLAQRGKRVRVFDKECPWEVTSSDPSIVLSTYSFERMRSDSFKEYVKLFPRTSIVSVARQDGMYEVAAEDGRRFQTPVPPLLAGGFEGSHKLVADFFDRREDGFPLLSQNDESTIVPKFFLCGPTVRHDKQVFCFIYKFRQRFAVVAKAIATSLGLPAAGLERYRYRGMFLDDLSCCGEECEC